VRNDVREIEVAGVKYQVIQTANSLPDDYEAMIDREQYVVWLSASLLPMRRGQVLTDVVLQLAKELAAN
jgi:hypothetical protein